MAINKLILLFLAKLVLLASCSDKKPFDRLKETNKLLELHKAQKEFHFNKDSIAIVEQLSENFISVNRGIISHPKSEESLKSFNDYFSAVNFIKWDDIEEPIIKFSDDGSMAYTIVDKLVVTSFIDQNGEPKEAKSHFAWTAIYKKYGDEWKIDCITSTSKPLNSTD